MYEKNGFKISETLSHVCVTGKPVIYIWFQGDKIFLGKILHVDYMHHSQLRKLSYSGWPTNPLIPTHISTSVDTDKVVYIVDLIYTYPWD